MQYIKRDIEQPLLDHLDKPEISLILGPRQVGKTTLMRRIQRQLAKEGAPTLFLNLDIETDWSYVTSQARLLKKIRNEFGEQSGYVFIDEIQRKEDAGRYLKGLYDMQLPYKFLVSGSGSLELKEKVVESLVGRKRIFEMAPVSFREFLQFRTGYRYEDRLDDWLELESEQRQLLLEKYLTYGGYPAVVAAATQDERVQVLADIYRSYLDRDINSIINIDKPREFGLLFQYLAGITGYPLNYSSIARQIALSTKTIQQYLWYLEKTFMIRLIRPFYRNQQKELTKAPTPYFVDLGMRNYLLQSWQPDGMGFQNLIANELHQASAPGNPPKYWRTKDKAEVDFITGTYQQPIPVEVKFRTLSRAETPRALRNFIRRYGPERAYVLHLGEAMDTEVGGTRVLVWPFYAWLEPLRHLGH